MSRPSRTVTNLLAAITPPLYHSVLADHNYRPKTLGWWNGRHVRLRGVCRKACGFKSRPEHHNKSRLLADFWRIERLPATLNILRRQSRASTRPRRTPRITASKSFRLNFAPEDVSEYSVTFVPLCRVDYT